MVDVLQNMWFLTNLSSLIPLSSYRYPGKPPVDAYGRPLYGGNPFDPPGSGKEDNDSKTGIVTSDGKTIAKPAWGSLPTGDLVYEEHADAEESSSEEESSGDDMDESDAEEWASDGISSVLPPPQTATATAPGDLRKQPAGDETPIVDAGPKQLYQVLQQDKATDKNQGGVFQSDVKYVVPGTAAAAVPEGAESVLSKAMAPSETAKRKRKHDDDDEEDLGKNFKF
jgi:splicing factor 3B subunit 2